MFICNLYSDRQGGEKVSLVKIMRTLERLREVSQNHRKTETDANVWTFESNLQQEENTSFECETMSEL